MSNLKIGPVDITGGTATLSNGGFVVGNNNLKVNPDGAVSMTSAYFPTTGGCVVTKGVGGDGSTFLNILGDSGKNRGVFLHTGNNLRWGQYVDSSTETGTEAGSNYTISRYNDTGGYLDNPMSISRASGVATFVNGVKVPTRSAGDNTEYAASTAFVLNAINTLGAGVTSFNTRTGAVTLTNGDVLSAVGNIVNTFNGRSGAVTLSSSDVTTALGYVPTNASSFGLRVKTLDSNGNNAADYGNITNPVLVFKANSINRTLLEGVTGSNIYIRSVEPPYVPPNNNAGACVHPLSNILTDSGLKFAQDIRPGDNIQTENGFTKVISTWVSTLGQRMWAQLNNKSVITSDHPVKLTNGKWGILDLKYYFETYPGKEYVCKTSQGMKRVVNTLVTEDSAVELKIGDITSDGITITNIEPFEGTPNYPVIHFVTEADSFISDGILVSSMGSCI